MKNTLQKIGSWAFIIGVLIALLAGIIDITQYWWLVPLLIVLGLIVGFLNISSDETTPFLLATVSIVIVTNFGGNNLADIPVVGAAIKSILSAIMTFVFPATIIVALKAIYVLARDL